MNYESSYELLISQQQEYQKIQADNLLKSLYYGQLQSNGQVLYPSFQPLPHSDATTTQIFQQAPSINTHVPTPISTSPVPKNFCPQQKSSKYIPKPIPLELGNLKTYSNPDILICGNCRDLFDDVVDMLDHKKNYCKMRFTCKCEDKEEQGSGQGNVGQRSVACLHSSVSGKKSSSEGLRVCLQCSRCEKTYTGAWHLMFHVQSAHGINIYALSDKSKKSFEAETGPTKLPMLNNQPQVNQSSEVIHKEL